jgi:short-subunit dehydrogenase
MNFLSQSLAIEYESKGIIVQTVCPGQVRTKLAQHFGQNFSEVNVNDFVSQAIKTVGIETITCGHLKHKLMSFVFNDIIKSYFGQRVISKFLFSIIKPLRTETYKKYNLTDTF